MIGVAAEMTRRGMTVPLLIALMWFVGSTRYGKAMRATAQDPDAARLMGAAQDGRNWLTTGRTYSEQRFSPLDQINRDNVKKLTVAWTYNTGDAGARMITKSGAAAGSWPALRTCALSTSARQSW